MPPIEHLPPVRFAFPPFARVRRAVACGMVALGLGLSGDAIADGGSPQDRRQRGTLESSEAPDRDLAKAFRTAARLAPLGPGLVEALHARAERSAAPLRELCAGLSASARGVFRVHALTNRESGHPLDRSNLMARELARLREQGSAPGSVSELVARKRAAAARAAGLGRQPGGIRPVYLEFEASEDGSGPSEQLRSETFAASFLAEVELAAALAGPRRTERIAQREVTLIGRSAEEGYEGLLALVMAAAKLDAIASELSTDGKTVGAVELEGYDPFSVARWTPRTLAFKEGQLVVVDGRSDLTQVTLCMVAIGRLIDLAREHAASSAAPLVGPIGAAGKKDTFLTEADVKRARALLRYLYLDLVAFHLDPQARSFASLASSSSPEPGLEASDVGPLLEALSVAVVHLDLEALQLECKKLFEAQIKSLTRALTAEAALADWLNIEGATGQASPGDTAAIVSGLYKAAEALESKAALDLAQGLVTRWDQEAWDPWVHLFLRSPASQAQVVTGLDGARALALLRGLGVDRGRPEAIARFESAGRAYRGLAVFPDPELGWGRKVTARVER